jgi:hypothetical protein
MDATSCTMHSKLADRMGAVYERAVEQEGTNPGRTSNKAREHPRAVIDPPFPKGCHGIHGGG